MADHTKIQWTDATFNPWVGCQKVGPGCDHCYAEGWGKRSGMVEWGPNAPRSRTSPANWRKPLAWDKAAEKEGVRRRVFCASLADVFDNHASILPEWSDDLWELIRATPNLDWQLLTKRPGNIGNMLPVPFDFQRHYPNVWIGCTVVNQAEADRDIPKLLKIDAAVRFLSIEPLLGPVDISWAFPDLRTACCHRCGFRTNAVGGYCPNDGEALRGDVGIDWVIVGGESGPGARPMHPDWARSLRDQCVAAGVAFFHKQNGEYAWARRVEGDPSTLTPYRIGKKAAGRLLDGREWNQMPGVAG